MFWSFSIVLPDHTDTIDMNTIIDIISVIILQIII